ncbi:metalloregulator ArsR/SmtB family transcription factor [Dyella lutea]|uniref:Metalloregulator ArsR/SmtB family transcription factor n=1 Tax=Dyella lutea TaxID=2950441 RepID=A0ABT1F8Y4_9GAMM|nr:metalloregulator ArsR/SmtB family transcription factor [Dyella lutea]
MNRRNPTRHPLVVETARQLKALGNPVRLLVLCRLHHGGEASVSVLAKELGVGMSALSQHLARMREEGLVLQRRQVRQLLYRLDESASAHLPAVLSGICGLARPPSTEGEVPMNKTVTALGAVLGLALASSGALAADNFWVTPTIHSAGKMHELPQASYKPDAKASYKIVFGLTKAAAKPDEVNPGIERVARTVNLYTWAGVPLKHLHIVAVAAGGATAIALDNAHYRQEFGTDNPNLPVIEELRKAGVDIAVCGQAVAEHKYPYEAIDKRVTLALSALTTITELQQKGYALMPL